MYVCMSLWNGKSAGMDRIPGVIWNYGREVLVTRLNTLIVDVCKSVDGRSGEMVFSYPYIRREINQSVIITGEHHSLE